MTSHKHKPASTQTYPWTQCVDWQRAHSEAAHGNVVELQTCACGWWRLVEVNGWHRHNGPWRAPQATAAGGAA